MRGLWFLAMVTVVIGSLLPGGSAAMHWISLLHVNDKTQHFLAYAVLAWFPVRIYSRTAALGACGMLVTLGVALEVLQSMVPGRSCELLDALADLGGVMSGFVFGWVLAVGARMMRTGASSGTPA